MLEKEYAYYTKNKSQLIKQYKAKYIVIVGDSVDGSFNSAEEAYSYAANKYSVGSFLIQHCVENEEEAIQTFHTRVVL